MRSKTLTNTNPQLISALGTGFLALATLGCASAEGPLEIRRTQTFEKALARQRALHAPETAPEDTPARHLQTGDAHRASGRNGEAHLAYVRAHFANREDLAPLERIAYLALREDPERARILFEELAADAPSSVSVRVGLGYALAATGELEAAQAQLRRAIEIDPDSQAALVTLGIVSDRIGDVETATGAYQQALEAGGQNAQILNNLGVSHLLADRPEAAVGFFKRARALQPRDAAVSNNLGLALGLLGRDTEAMTAFQRNGTEGDALNNLGLAHYLRGDFAGARILFERALLTDDTDELRVLRNLERLERTSQQQDGA